MKRNAWDHAAKREVHRIDPSGSGLVKLDPGVNFFVLALEELGARTYYSCEGHPTGFYVTFSAPVETANKISQCGYLGVELAGRFWINRYLPAGLFAWSLRMDARSAPHRDDCLRGAAQSWMENLPLMSNFWRHTPEWQESAQ